MCAQEIPIDFNNNTSCPSTAPISHTVIHLGKTLVIEKQINLYNLLSTVRTRCRTSLQICATGLFQLLLGDYSSNKGISMFLLISSLSVGNFFVYKLKLFPSTIIRRNSATTQHAPRTSELDLFAAKLSSLNELVFSMEQISEKRTIMRRFINH